MGEVSDDIELDLGLSIGGSFKKSEIEKPNGGLDKTLSEYSHAPPGTAADPQGTREIHALRRQEAKRKREEKKGQSRARNGEMCGSGGSPVSGDEKVEGFDSEEVELKKNRIESNGSAKLDSNHNNGGSSSPYPVMQMQFPYPPIQYFPVSNGFAIPYVMPYFAPNAAAPPGGGGGKEKQAVACRSFVPFQGNLSSGVNVQNGCESEQNGGGGNRKATSNLSSSVVSDNRSSSHEGGETRSNSSHSQPDQPQIEQSTVASNPSGPNGDANAPVPVNTAPEAQTQPNTKPTSTKPPKPQAQNHPLPQMPCVSATGNGPDGKTVTGVLYRYTTNEVSIVCVCHGSSFSPAEFVAHAGGTDVTNPLKHITVIPSAFG